MEGNGAIGGNEQMQHQAAQTEEQGQMRPNLNPLNRKPAAESVSICLEESKNENLNRNRLGKPQTGTRELLATPMAHPPSNTLRLDLTS